MAEAIGILNLREPKSELERRGKIGEVLTFISKFAFESTVFQSLRISTGRKREESKDEAVPEDLKLVIEKMQANINRAKQRCEMMGSEISDQTLRDKIEKMQKDMNDVAVQCKTSTKCTGNFEKNPEGEEDLVGKNRKRVFIRSRL